MKCKSCGADIQFDPKTQKLTCEYCGNSYDPADYEVKAKESTEHKDYSTGEIDTKMYTCTQCGAKILVFDETAVTFCSYCGSNQIIAPQLYKEEKPEYVIPFMITKEECEKAYKKAISKFIFAPKSMKEDVVVNKFRGIYMPYGVYKVEHHGPQTNKGEKYSHRSGDYVIYNIYSITTNIDAEYEGMAFDLASQFEDRYSQAIAPFDFHAAIPFDVKYLSGYYADAKDVDKNVYSSEANALTMPLALTELRKDRNFRKWGCYDPKVTLRVTDAKTAYYPVYFLAIKNKDKRISYAVVNGQTGKVAVDMPVDFMKYIIFSVLLTIPIFIVLDFVLKLVFKPVHVAIFGLIISIISLIFNLSQRKQLRERELRLDDKGYKSKNAKKNTTKEHISPMNIIFELVAIGICAFLLTSWIVFDETYYIGAFIAIGLIVFSFKGLIDQHNKLTSRKLEQLNARGGDENA